MTEIRSSKSDKVTDTRTAQEKNLSRNPGLSPVQTKKQLGQRGNQLKAQAERAKDPVRSYGSDKRAYGRARGEQMPKQNFGTPKKRAPLNATQQSNKAKNPGMFPTTPKAKGKTK